MKKGFSLMEMMIVLLIVAIIAAASAPMVNKKMVRDAAGSSSPWVWTSLTNNSIAFNLDGSDSATATIGATGTPKGLNSRLYIASSKSDIPQISLFGHGKYTTHIKGADNSIIITDRKDASEQDAVVIGHGTTPAGRSVILGINAGGGDGDSVFVGAAARNKGNGTNILAVGFDCVAEGNYATVVGSKAYAGANSTAVGSYSQATGISSIAIGGLISSSNYIGAKSSGTYSIAIGTSSNAAESASTAIGTGSNAAEASTAIGKSSDATGTHSTAMGFYSNAAGGYSMAIGTSSDATAYGSIAMGTASNAAGSSSMALGYAARASHPNSTAIGKNAQTTASNQIVLGDENTTVVVPGTIQFNNLKVSGNLEVVGTTRLGTGGHDTYVSLAQFNESRRQMLRLRHSDGEGRQNVRVSVSSDRRLKNVGKAFVGGLEQVKKLEVFNYTYKKDSTNTPHVGVMAQDLQKIFPDAVFKGDDGFLRIRMEDMFYAMINAIKELDTKVTYLMDREKRINDLQKQVNALDKRLTALEKKRK